MQKLSAKVDRRRDPNDNILSWGNNYHGQLGANDTMHRFSATPLQVAFPYFAPVTFREARRERTTPAPSAGQPRLLLEAERLRAARHRHGILPELEAVSAAADSRSLTSCQRSVRATRHDRFIGRRHPTTGVAVLVRTYWTVHERP